MLDHTTGEIHKVRSSAGVRDWSQMNLLAPGTTDYTDATATGSDRYDYKLTG